MGAGGELLTDEMLEAQLAWADHARASGIPFMARVPPIEGGPLVRVRDDHRMTWRALLFEWLNGEHIIEVGTGEAQQIGAFLRRLHDVGATFPRLYDLPVRDLAADRLPWLTLLDDALPMLPNPSRARNAVSALTTRTRQHLEQVAGLEVGRVAVHGDVNVPNVLWEGGLVSGLVDLDQVSAGSPLDELAWVLKWWAGQDHRLARAIVAGYGPVPAGPLASLTWLATCCHSYLVEGVVDDVREGDHEGVCDRISMALKQGDALLATAMAATS